MKFKLVESNELEKMQKYNKRKQRGLSPFSYLNPNAGNVEHNVSMFNNSINTDASTTTSLGEDYYDDYDDSVYLSYDDIYVQGNKRAEDDWDEYKIDYKYKVNKDDLIEFLVDIVVDDDEFISDEDAKKYENASSKELTEFVYKVTEENLDKILSKYKNKVLDHFRDAATKQANNEYDPNADYYSDMYYDEYRDSL